VSGCDIYFNHFEHNIFIRYLQCARHYAKRLVYTLDRASLPKWFLSSLLDEETVAFSYYLSTVRTQVCWIPKPPSFIISLDYGAKSKPSLNSKARREKKIE
jgi:hypothetical protein